MLGRNTARTGGWHGWRGAVGNESADGKGAAGDTTMQAWEKGFASWKKHNCYLDPFGGGGVCVEGLVGEDMET